MKDDERRFLIDVYSRCGWVEALNSPRVTPRDVINEPGFYMHEKRVLYILEKWDNKGWYRYGVTLDLGWLTEEGKEAAQRAIDLATEDENWMTFKVKKPLGASKDWKNITNKAVLAALEVSLVADAVYNRERGKADENAADKT